MDTDCIILLDHLSKNFGKLRAVDDVSLKVYPGDVFGFLGPNGAGKSTTIRMLLSLITPSSGEIKIFGRDLLSNRDFILKKTGCIVEKPDFYLYLSGEKNLSLFSALAGHSATQKRIDEVLELVGLKGRGKDKVKHYSHGMKQRLGIAQTIIHNPDLIVLDEPTTGLDPQGIIDVRNLIIHLHRDLKKTVFISSHILSEIELIATRMAILNKGRTVVQGKVTDLLSSEELIVSIETDDLTKAKTVVSNSKWSSRLKTGSGHLDFDLSKNEIPLLIKFLNEAGISIFSTSYKRTLEDYFLKLTSEPAIHEIPEKEKTISAINE